MRFDIGESNDLGNTTVVGEQGVYCILETEKYGPAIGKSMYRK